MTEEEFNAMRDKALEQLMSGKSLTGEGGVFEPMLKQFLESALEAEMDGFLDEKQRKQKNKRNGRGKKRIKSSSGEFEINTPQDRQSNFQPQIVKKRERVLADSLTNKILTLYGKGMSLRDISSYIKEMYNSDISPATLSQITDKIIPEIKQWQDRDLERIYPIVWLDAIHFKVKEEGRITSKALYTILAVNRQGIKELLGLFISESEGANFWLQILTDLNNRGVEDILIACTDNLKGFREAIEQVYPKAEHQSCVIHQIRNTMRYVSTKDSKEVMKDLKTIYKANTKDGAEANLEEFSKKWGRKYPLVVKSWNENWESLSTYFAYSPEIRRIIYTTNAVEGYHRQIRKVTKTKGAFTSETALMKIVYLATREIIKKWTKPLRHWGTTIQQFAIRFGEDRLDLDL